MNIRKIPKEDAGDATFTKMTSPGEPDYDEMKQVTIDALDVNKRLKEHFLFPREDSVANFPAALRVATELLMSQSDYASADNHIILITNGFTNCRANAPDGTPDCGRWDEVAYAEDSIDDSIEFALGTLAPKKIHLSIMMFSEMAKPHQVMRKGTQSTNSNRCMKEHEAIEQGQPVVDYSETGETPYKAAVTATTNVNSGETRFESFFVYPNKLYTAVSATKGVWAPVRRPCSPTSGQLGTKTCSEGGLVEHLDAQCSGQTTTGAPLPAIGGNGRPPGFPAGTEPITDSKGRLVCDALCRPRRDQLRDYIDEIFDRNPLAKVDDGVKVN